MTQEQVNALVKHVKAKMMDSEFKEYWPRFEKLLADCPRIQYDIANVCLHAMDQGPAKVVEVLDLLETHYNEDLFFQHPEIRGTVSDRLLGTNKTTALFQRICAEVLQLKPNPAA